jgi:two-component system response regulator AtoC
MEYPFIGNHPSIVKIRELISTVSDLALSVLILGETGTGKEVVARLLHQSSSRKDKRFIKVNCAALPFNLLESELFGYEKGAFTGADRLKPGKFELASEGVILLDEIGDMPIMLQAKLLNVLQSGEFNRVGGIKDVKVNSWVISSTNHDLNKDMRLGLFREDLYYRLNIIKVEIPPLRERTDDIPLLIDHFISKNKNELNMEENYSIGPDLSEIFQTYHWPGNVRELAGTIVRLMLGDDPIKVKTEMLENMQADGIEVPKEFMPSQPFEPDLKQNKDEQRYSSTSLKDMKEEATKFIEKKAISHILNLTGWNKSEAARKMQISYKALLYKMDGLGIQRRSSEKQ